MTPRTDDYVKNMIRRMLVDEGYVREQAPPPVITIGPDCEPRVLEDAGESAMGLAEYLTLRDRNRTRADEVPEDDNLTRVTWMQGEVDFNRLARA